MSESFSRIWGSKYDYLRIEKIVFIFGIYFLHFFPFSFTVLIWFPSLFYWVHGFSLIFLFFFFFIFEGLGLGLVSLLVFKGLLSVTNFVEIECEFFSNYLQDVRGLDEFLFFCFDFYVFFFFFLWLLGELLRILNFFKWSGETLCTLLLLDFLNLVFSLELRDLLLLFEILYFVLLFFFWVRRAEEGGSFLVFFRLLTYLLLCKYFLTYIILLANFNIYLSPYLTCQS